LAVIFAQQGEGYQTLARAERREGAHLGLVGNDLEMGIEGGVLEKVGDDGVGETNDDPGVL
jgi:hypothetical protein